jgi:acyl transferase domain-containing protein
VGPCYSIDTACASALAALHVCASAVGAGDCEDGVTVGTKVLSEAGNHATSAGGMTSPLGRCHTFDQRADGYCRGEGCGAFLLTGRSSGEDDEMGVAAVRILGSAVQQDGPSASLTAPNGSSQKRLIETVRRAIGGSEDVPSLEAHGTGTALGDPIEVGAADRAWLEECRDFPSRSRPKAQCTSLKSNMGHLEAAAAAAGLASLILTPLGAAEVAINAQMRGLNAHLSSIVSSKTPLSMHLPVEQILRVEVAGGANNFKPRSDSRLSSFGFSGTIAHGAFATLGLPVRDTPSVASRYRGQLADRVDISPLL